MEKSKISWKQHQVIYEAIDSKSFSCYICNYTAFSKHHLIDHMTVHDNKNCVSNHTKKNHANASNRTVKVHSCSCSHCGASFRETTTLDEHIIRKHPNYMSSVTRRLHECTKCTFKTVRKCSLDKHLLKHPEIASNFKPKICIHCNATFKGKMSLDDHVVRKHPVSISSVTSKLYECTKCTFKTTVKSSFDKHVHDNKNSVSNDTKKNHANASNRTAKVRSCSHCDASFRDRKALDGHVLKTHPNFISSITRKTYICRECDYKTFKKDNMNRHMSVHLKTEEKLIRCIHCDATFLGKLNLDRHIIIKHPDFMSSITSKLYECTKCPFKTVRKDSLNRHLREHPEVASNFKLSVCIHCNATFKSKQSLDDHVVRKHPDFFTTVTSKVHECTKCTFKTVNKGYFDKHLLKHSDFKYSACVHCNATFKRKVSLDDHVVKKHPDFVSSITTKLHECTKCTFKTVIKSHFDTHLLKHSDFKYSACVHCNATFNSKKSLDDHVLRKHPDFFTAVTYKVRECIKCSFKTIIKRCFDRHLLNHPELVSDPKLCICSHCNATFKGKVSLDDHVVKKHTDFISSITSKLHECTKCTFKTTSKGSFDEHLVAHPEVASDLKLTNKIYECIERTEMDNYDRYTIDRPFPRLFQIKKRNTFSHCNGSFKAKIMEKSKLSWKQHQVICETIGSKSFSCYICNYTAFSKHHLVDHMNVHSNKNFVSNHTKKNNPNASNRTVKVRSCSHCDASFRDRRALDEHVIRKHPNFMSSVTRKLHECTKCTYKTVKKRSFDKHLLRHPEIASNFKLSSKVTLDDHVVRKHPDFSTTVTSKVHKCTKCTFKAVKKDCFDKHLLKHLGLASDLKHITCVHCNATFKSKITLDHHVLRKHPDFVTTVTSKLHECTECAYKTVIKTFAETFGFCTAHATFKSKKSLADDVLRKHPDFFTAVTYKVREYIKSGFKIIINRSFGRRLLNHPELVSDLNLCIAGIVTRHLQTNAHWTITSMEKSKLSWKQHQVINEAVHSESFSCYICNYTAFSKHQLVDHMNVHDNKNCVPGCIKKDHCNVNTTIKTVSPDSCSHCASFRVRKALGAVGCETKHKLSRCMHCNATFSYKSNLDEHIISSRPDFISSITRKLHECTKCTFKTVKKPVFEKHLLRHPEFALDFKLNMCLHCNKTFKHKKSLDDHVVRKHPDFFNTVTSKLHECTKCTFKTVKRSCFSKHLLKHPGLASDFKHITCVHCNATFKSKMSLDDHVVRKHPDFISSVTSKLYECTKCTFKTVKKSFFCRHLLKHSGLVSDFKHITKHLLKHPGLASDFKHITCVHCNATFKSKITLDHHVLRKHPDFVTTVASKLHECTECAYKTVIKSYFDKHLLKHSDFAQHMHDRVLRKHPDFFTAVIYKVREYIKSGIKTIINRSFDRRLLNHPELVSDLNLCISRHCNATFTNKSTLDNHVFRKHPEFITTVAGKIYECPKCAYKTTFKNIFKIHISAHPENVSNKKLNTCMHCYAIFRTIYSLDGHVAL
nr:unnamed protein product [Callosobruchus analis]